MSFDALWLDLREPADAVARDSGLLAAAARLLRPGDRVLDLGCGTGATVRAFAGRVEGLRWRLVDCDAGLLELAAARCPGAETLTADLGDLELLPIEGVALVTASALLDLASAAWVEALAGRLSKAAVGVYVALSFDGKVRWEPALPGDAAVVEAFNRHQRRDKGLGPALGAEAPAALAQALAGRGYAVRTAASPWLLGPGEATLQAALAEGMAAAAEEEGAGAADWLQARLAASASSVCTVGHVDLLALPRAQSNTTSESRP